MAGRGAQRPADERTFEGRLRAARLASSYNAQQLAELCGRQSGQTVYDWENPAVAGSPNPEQLGILSKATGKSLRYLVFGEDDEAGESEFISDMRQVENALGRRRQRDLKRIADALIQEDRENEREIAMKRLLDDPEVAARFERLLEERRESQGEATEGSASSAG